MLEGRPRNKKQFITFWWWCKTRCGKTQSSWITSALGSEKASRSTLGRKLMSTTCLTVESNTANRIRNHLMTSSYFLKGLNYLSTFRPVSNVINIYMIDLLTAPGEVKVAIKVDTDTILSRDDMTILSPKAILVCAKSRTLLNIRNVIRRRNVITIR